MIDFLFVIYSQTGPGTCPVLNNVIAPDPRSRLVQWLRWFVNYLTHCLTTPGAAAIMSDAAILRMRRIQELIFVSVRSKIHTTLA